jgi:hypothetical protein
VKKAVVSLNFCNNFDLHQALRENAEVSIAVTREQE